MTTEQPVAPATPAWQKRMNRFIRGVLRTPLLCRLLGRKLLTLSVVGRTSGRRYEIPVAYARHDGSLLVGTSAAWVRNLRTGDQIDVRLKGRRLRADVEVCSGRDEVVELYDALARRNANFAVFMKIPIDKAGQPDRGRLNRMWAAGARAVRLTVATQLGREETSRAGT